MPSMTSKQITVVIIVHNMAKELEALLNSLENQTLSIDNFDILVIDDGSSDHFESALSGYKKNNITYARFDQHGRGMARNFGVYLSKTDWIAFIDADCIADKNWVQSLYDKISDNLIGVEGIVNCSPQIKPLTHSISNTETISFFTCNIMYRKSVLLKAGGFNPAFSFIEDTDMGLSVFEKGKIFKEINAIVFHPDRREFFFKNLFSSRLFANMVMREEYLLYLRHGEKCRRVRWTPFVEKSLWAHAFKYCNKRTRPFIKAGVFSPFKLFLHLLLMATRQFFMLVNYSSNSYTKI